MPLTTNAKPSAPQKRVEAPAQPPRPQQQAPKTQPASQLHPSNDPVVNGSDLNNSSRVQPPISAPNMNR